jgi:hypothetical protein
MQPGLVSLDILNKEGSSWLIRPIPEFVVSAVYTALRITDYFVYLILCVVSRHNGIRNPMICYHVYQP